MWDNRGIAAIPPTAAASFIVLFRVLARASRAGGATAAVTCKRAKLRGRRARGDDFAHCALISLGDVRRDDGAAPWRAVEMIPPPGKVSELGAWVELVLEFSDAAAVDEVVVLKSDPRMRALAAGETANSNANAAPEPPSPRVVTRWPGLGGGPARVEIGETLEKKTEPARDVGIGKTPEKRTPPRVAGGVFAEGRSPEGPLVEGVSFTPPAARSDGEDGDEFPETSRARPRGRSRRNRWRRCFVARERMRTSRRERPWRRRPRARMTTTRVSRRLPGRRRVLSRTGTRPRIVSNPRIRRS